MVKNPAKPVVQDVKGHSTKLTSRLEIHHKRVLKLAQIPSPRTHQNIDLRFTRPNMRIFKQYPSVDFYTTYN